MEEIWKSILDFPNYEVSNLGRVKRLRHQRKSNCRSTQHFKERLILTSPDNLGYPRVSLRIGDKTSYRRVHRLVYIAFNGFISSKDYIDHINGNRVDNSISNLRLVTHQQNCFNKKDVKGYYWSKIGNAWASYINKNGKRIHLGYFNSEKEARMAYVRGVIKYHEGFHEAKVTKEEIKEAMASRGE